VRGCPGQNVLRVNLSNGRTDSPVAFATNVSKLQTHGSLHFSEKKSGSPSFPLPFQNYGSSAPLLCVPYSCFAVRLVGGTPEVTHGAAGSAIKGVGVLPRNLPAPAGSSVLPVAGNAASPIALIVFTISRDRRLSRWDLAEENQQLDGRDGRQRAEKGERKRWRLRWRAGCITDVADVSGLDVVVLPGDTIQEDSCSRSTRNDSPSVLVAVSGQGLQLVLFGAC